VKRFRSAESMMKKTLRIITVLVTAVCVAESAKKDIYEEKTPPKVINEIDRIVFAKLKSMGIRPILCSDAVFVRRAYLDVIGKIPTADEARSFIDDRNPRKRMRLIEELLEREEFADYWAMKWSDVLRIKAEFPINLWPNAAQAYHRWVYESIAANKPYDQFVREMLISSGSNFRVGPVNFYRAAQNKTPEGIAKVVALTFMGVRTEKWPKERLDGMAAFFSQIGYKPTNEWKEEYVFWDPLGTTKIMGNAAPGAASIDAVVTGAVVRTRAILPKKPVSMEAVFPDGKKIILPPDRDPRFIFADWLIRPENPWFTKCIVNRIWAWLLGRGIIHEPDDIRPDNPPSNPKLLLYLEKEMVKGGYDMKHLYRLILTSSTYQLASTSYYDNPAALANFACYPIRRMDAEVLIDAINQITGTTELYTSAIPEPFTYIPKEMRAVEIADGSITSPFLTMFGRSARATGEMNERNYKPVFAQWLHLLNSGHIQEKLEKGPHLREIITAKRRPEEKIKELYLTVLSRYPTEEEIEKLMEYGHFNAVTKSRPKPVFNKKAKKKHAKWSEMTAKQRKAAKAKQAKLAKLTPKQRATEKKKKAAAAENTRKSKAATAQKNRMEAKKRFAAAKAAASKMRESWIDIAWMLINSQEFLYRH